MDIRSEVDEEPEELDTLQKIGIQFLYKRREKKNVNISLSPFPIGAIKN